MKTGYVADDAMNSSFTGGLQVEKLTAIDTANKIVKSWIVEQGRWFPVGFYYGYAQWHLIHSIVIYKALQVLGVVVASGLTWWLMRLLGYSRALASLVILAFTCIIQLRAYFDSILSFTQLMPLVWSGITASLIFFVYWIRKRKALLALGSLLFLALAMSTYEGMQLLFPLYVLVAYFLTRNWRRTILFSIPPALLCAFFLGLTFWLRAQASVGAGGPYAASYDKGEIFYTVSDQILAALPLSYKIFDPQGVFAGQPGSPMFPSIAVGAAAFLIAGILARGVSREGRPVGQEPVPAVGWLAGFGVLLAVLASLPIGLSTRYQGELIAGLGHVQTFLGYIGVGMIIAALLCGLVRRFHRVGVVAAAILLAAVATLSYRANEQVVANLQPARWSYDNEVSAMEAGLFDRVTVFSALFAANQGQSPWQNAYFYRQFSGKTVSVEPVEKYNPTEVTPRRQGCDSSKPGRVWTSAELRGDRGYVYLTCIDYQSGGDTYVYLSGISRSDVIAVAGLKRPNEPDAYKTWTRAGKEALIPVRGHAGLYRLNAPGPIDPRTFRLLFS